MYQLIEESTGDGLVALRLNGRLVHDDYEEFVPKLEAEIARHGAIRCLIDIVDLEGITLRAVWDEIRFDLKHADDVTRCAVVGDRRWESWATSAVRPIFRKAHVRYFERADYEEALAWVREDVAPPAS